jgi:hypothetical protein
MTYDDGRIACTDDALVIRRYYFPVGDKRIPYGAIERVRSRTMTGTSGQLRLWGSGDFVHWYNFDPDRRKKTLALEVHPAGRQVVPVITPDNADSVVAELTAHGVTIENLT